MKTLIIGIVVGAVVALTAVIVWQNPSMSGGPKIDEKATLSILRSEAMAFLVTKKIVTQLVVEHSESDFFGDWRGVLWATVKWNWGADLQKITAADIRTEGNIIYCKLPQPELLDFSVEPGSVDFMSKSTAIPKLKEIMGSISQRKILEDRLREQALKFAADKNLTPSRQEMVDQINRATAVLRQSGGTEIRFE